MKRSRLIVLTLAGVSLGSTGCRREASTSTPAMPANTAVLSPLALSPQLRDSLPAYSPGAGVPGQSVPHNAYDPALGYFHQPCSAWFPYPYDHHDPRWGWYRCGRWSRHMGSTAYRHSSGAIHFRPSPLTGTEPDYDTQPAGAPQHRGVPHEQALASRASIAGVHPQTASHAGIVRSGFGSTGHGTGFGFRSFSGS